MNYTMACQLDPSCLLIGLNQRLAEKVRLRTMQRLADYVDGLRRECAAAATPPPAKFRILIQGPEASGSASEQTQTRPAPRRKRPATAARIPAVETRVEPAPEPTEAHRR